MPQSIKGFSKWLPIFLRTSFPILTVCLCQDCHWRWALSTLSFLLPTGWLLPTASTHWRRRTGRVTRLGRRPRGWRGGSERRGSTCHAIVIVWDLGVIVNWSLSGTAPVSKAIRSSFFPRSPTPSACPFAACPPGASWALSSRPPTPSSTWPTTSTTISTIETTTRTSTTTIRWGRCLTTSPSQLFALLALPFARTGEHEYRQQRGHADGHGRGHGGTPFGSRPPGGAQEATGRVRPGAEDAPPENAEYVGL